jgi:hypothetical protein
MLKIKYAVVTTTILAALIAGCSSGDKKEAAGGAKGGESQMQQAAEGHQNSAGGITWTAPSDWKTGPAQQMRVVTYLISAIEGDVDSAELAVFHFPGSGGAKDANLQRWAGQFEQADGRNSADLAKIKEMKANGLKITTIELAGIYRVSAGPMMEVKEKKTGYALKGAIIEGPQGMVFFKMTGPEKTVAASGDDFSKMINSAKAG